MPYDGGSGADNLPMGDARRFAAWCRKQGDRWYDVAYPDKCPMALYAKECTGADRALAEVSVVVCHNNKDWGFEMSVSFDFPVFSFILSHDRYDQLADDLERAIVAGEFTRPE